MLIELTKSVIISRIFLLNIFNANSNVKYDIQNGSQSHIWSSVVIFAMVIIASLVPPMAMYINTPCRT